MPSNVSEFRRHEGQARPDEICPDHRRSLGIYYTPIALSGAIAYWAIRTRKDTVLEPSFGGCAFLAAARQRLVTLNAQRPGRQLAGCDIDQSAFSFLQSIAGKRPAASRYLKRNFLSVEPGTFPIDEFTCVLGNPPFVRHNQISSAVKHTISKMHQSENRLPKTAGLWAHFVSHGLRFLATGGRMGLVLPGSFLFAEYARPLRESLRSNFARTIVVRLNYQTFAGEGAEERAVILLAEGFGTHSPSDWTEIVVGSERAAVDAIKGMRKSAPRLKARSCHAPAGALYAELARDKSASSLAEFAKIDIGVVTGDNKFFVLNAAKAEHEGLSKSVFTPIIARAAFAPGLNMRSDDLEALCTTQRPCLLLRPDNIRERHTSLRRYLSTMSRTKRKTGVWLNKRTRWFCPDVGQFPDAMLTYMNHRSPRLVLIEQKDVTCTNTLHRVWLPNLDSTGRKLLALSLQSSFSQLSAEIEGRWYGGGVLKIEPSDARRLKLFMPVGLDAADVNGLHPVPKTPS